MNKKYLIAIIAVASAALALAAFLEDLAAAFIVIIGSAIFWQNHKIEEAEQVARQDIPG